MNWISYPENRPTISKTYIVSIRRPYMGADLTFSYIAYYDAETNRWHKNDNFDNDSVKEVITERIVGWNDDLTAYLG
ncbi:hypothetical protein [Flavobacterium denitrificans]|uniref:hypothetical protein n=1 Tax=Flavobacterium denitrificans TaxID=281361 RepID=UPI0012F98F62|nr:hypothetical protein [Flavobacterium denitrificans]